MAHTVEIEGTALPPGKGPCRLGVCAWLCISPSINCGDQVKPPRAGIVIVNWNGWQDTIDCVTSLLTMTDQDFHVVVVDNGSENQSVQEIHDRFPKLQILEMGFNAGFSTANNAGIRTLIALGVQFVWLLNNDTKVDPHALTHLLHTASSENVGIVGAVIFEASEPNQIQAWGGGSLNPKLGTTKLFKAKTDQPLEQILGASMFFPVGILQKVGLLHEAFFFYLEDTELSYRVQQAGYRLLVAEQCLIWHKGGSSVNAGQQERSLLSERHFAKANGVFLGLHAGPHSIICVPLRMIGMALRRVQRGQLHRLPLVYAAFLSGFVHGLKHRTGAAT